MIIISQVSQGLLLPLKVTPKSGKDAILPYTTGDDRIHLKVRAVPEDGKANQAVVALLAKAMKLPKSCLEVVHGEQSRYKTVSVVTADTSVVVEKLAKILQCSAADCLNVQLKS